MEGSCQVNESTLVLSNGIGLSTESLRWHARFALAKASSGKPLWILTLNLQMLALAARDPGYLILLRQASLVVADGMPLVWLARFSGFGKCTRTNGTDLMRLLLNLAPEHGIRIGLIGGRQPKRVQDLHPKAVKYVFDGAIGEKGENLGLPLQQCAAKGVAIAAVALGVPKQDVVCQQITRLAPSIVVIGVGGALDLIGGTVPEAPRPLKRVGLEWAYRLATEPRRLWARYLTLYPTAIRWLIRELYIQGRLRWFPRRHQVGR